MRLPWSDHPLEKCSHLRDCLGIVSQNRRTIATLSRRRSDDPRLPVADLPKLSPAEGAFYIWADVSGRTNDSAAFCARMLHEAGIAVSPSVGFDHARGNRFLRFSYCGPEADMREAAERLKGWR
jgi:aspartate/methionine/tyrosine aminotransferase